MNETLNKNLTLIQEVANNWCDNWTPTSYNDPRISLRQIADRARNVLEKENQK